MKQFHQCFSTNDIYDSYYSSVRTFDASGAVPNFSLIFLFPSATYYFVSWIVFSILFWAAANSASFSYISNVSSNLLTNGILEITS